MNGVDTPLEQIKKDLKERQQARSVSFRDVMINLRTGHDIDSQIYRLTNPTPDELFILKTIATLDRDYIKNFASDFIRTSKSPLSFYIDKRIRDHLERNDLNSLKAVLEAPEIIDVTKNERAALVKISKINVEFFAPFFLVQRSLTLPDFFIAWQTKLNDMEKTIKEGVGDDKSNITYSTQSNKLAGEVLDLLIIVLNQANLKAKGYPIDGVNTVLSKFLKSSQLREVQVALLKTFMLVDSRCSIAISALIQIFQLFFAKDASPDLRLAIADLKWGSKGIFLSFKKLSESTLEEIKAILQGKEELTIKLDIVDEEEDDNIQVKTNAYVEQKPMADEWENLDFESTEVIDKQSLKDGLPIEPLDIIDPEPNLDLLKKLEVFQPAPREIPKTRFIPKKIRSDIEILYRNMPWIIGKVVSVYILPITKSTVLYNSNDSYSVEDEVFFRPTSAYYALQANATQKTQNNEELNLVDDAGILHVIKVGILTTTEFIVQDPSLFQVGEDFIEEWTKSLDTRKHEVLNSEVTPVVVSVATNYLNLSLKQAIPNITKDLVPAIIDHLKQKYKMTSEFLKVLASILVYLFPKESQISIIPRESLFVKRVALLYYKPTIFDVLSEKEKLPEIYDNPKVSTKTQAQVSKVIYSKTKEIFNLMIESIVNWDIIPTRKPTKPNKLGQVQNLKIQLPPWKDVCANVEHVGNLNDEDLVFYTENGKVYCFEINDLFNRFSTNDIINPETGLAFNNLFVRRILTVYSTRASKVQSPKSPQESISYSEDQEPGPLIAMIQKELSRIENLFLQQIPEYTVEHFSKNNCLKCKDKQPTMKISSIYRNQPVTFCSLECLEDQKF